MSKTIALLYFSRKAKAEGNGKKWYAGSSSHKNQQLAKTLIDQSSKAVAKSGLEVFHFHEGNQEGRSFGQRLANAYEELFNKGFSAVVAVGNDSPEIINLDWEFIKSQLKEGKNVLGRTIRGGAYLLGITSKSYKKQEFESLPWQSNRLYDSLLSQVIDGQSSVVELQSLRDLNTFFDLKLFLESKSVDSALSALVNFLDFKKLLFQFKSAAFLTHSSRSLPLRAPPIQ